MAYDAKVSLLASGGLPIGLGSSGSIGANGALTLNTGFAVTYPGIYLFFPAGALFANSPAGFYYCVMTSSTQGTVFNNLYVNGVPTTPAVLNPIVSASIGAYTQATTIQTALSIPIPGGSMGANGSLEIECQASIANSASNKTVTVPWGAGNLFNLATTTNAAMWLKRAIFNSGATNVQATATAGVMGPGVTAGNVQQFNVDTTVNQNLLVQLTLASAADFNIVSFFRVLAFFA